MSETVVTPAASAEPVVAAPAPVVAPAEVAPAVVAVAPAPAVAEPAPAPVAPAAEPVTVIGDALKTPEPAPAEPTVETTPEPEKVEGQSEEPAPPPTYEPFTLPEGVTFAEDRTGEFTGLLGEFESLTKADHTATQEFGQKLVDFHLAEMQRGVDEINRRQMEAWQAQRLAWKDAFLQDPEIGGNRFQTSVDSAIQFIRTHGGTDEQQAEFRQLMETSGLGNHPAMIRLLAKAGAAMSEGRPLAATQPASPVLSKTQKMYGRSGG